MKITHNRIVIKIDLYYSIITHSPFASAQI